MRSFRLGAAVLGAALVVSGCRGERFHRPPVDDDDDQTDTSVSIAAIQGGEVELGAPVKLKGVVVTGIDRHGKNTGGVWVQDLAGGELSGITIRSGMDITDGEDELTVDDLKVGDLVDVEGVYDEFALAADMSGNKVSQINHPSRDEKARITRTGKSAPVPAPVDVDALLFATDPLEAEKWEGVLIRFTNVAVLQAPKSASSSDATLFEMKVSGPAIVQNALFAFEAPPMSITPDTCFGSITGIGDYFFDYKIQPRSADDLVLTGGSCPPRTEAGACSDEMDNDHDGKTDAEDADCAVTLTIPEIQVAGTEPGPLNGQPVELKNVVITAYRTQSPNSMGVTAPRRTYYVSTREATQTARNSVLLFLTTGVDFPVGAVVNVKGDLTEFNNETEIDKATLTCANGGALPADCEVITPPAFATIAVADLATEASAEPWESVMVKLTNVKFKEYNATDKYWVFTAKVGADPVAFNVENYAYGSSVPTSCPFGNDGAMPTPKCLSPEVGACYSEISGFVRYVKAKTRVGVNPYKPTHLVVAASPTACD